MARRTLEIALDYRCNLRCLGCRACDGAGDSLAPGRAAALLREAFEAGSRVVWFGGGEPTLRDDLLPLVSRARDLGYESIVVQTNGVRLSYAAYARALLGAGVTEVRVNAKSARAEVHDALSAVPGTHGLLVKALEHLASHGARVAADVLLTGSTAPHLDETLTFFADRGVKRFALWLLYAGDAAAGTDARQADVAREVPRIADVVPAIERAARVARERGLELLSFHTPPCTLPAGLRSLVAARAGPRHAGGGPRRPRLRARDLALRGRGAHRGVPRLLRFRSMWGAEGRLPSPARRGGDPCATIGRRVKVGNA